MALRRRLSGLLFAALLVALCGLSVAAYQKVFTPRVTVLLRTDHVGNQLQAESDVKLLGVLVGEVRAIRSRGDGAEVELGLHPGQVDRIPANVSARLLPKTLFGERFVSLELPEDPAGALGDGAVIEQDRTSGAVELERVLADLLPTLQAVRPDKLSSALTSMAQALDGRGATLGQAIVRLDAYLRELNPQLPVLKEDISEFADVTGVYADAGPDLLRALSDATAVSRTIAEQRADLDAVYSSLTTASADLTGFLRANGETVVALADRSRPTFELLATYSPEFGCVLSAVNAIRPRMDQVLGKGTDQPGVHVEFTVVPPAEKYVPGRDDPVHRGGGPHCPSGPATAVAPDRVPEWAGLLTGGREGGHR
ncbi:MCE family protein [Saccharothrix texasensis]|uniref:Phospholipid/cholesterol/gamma-HCH transport system substrate-binding protein n=1 Tax=Saccharothrix texasensis TaxID=103734 RepID=A0A3N1H1E3_9PSEU|nr:MCE family protein [Saccharothrix texasensis]ROP36337.1 phospholipid/cholesterol/gamma-HCH transport system substrate-binding protein [Saccharothrix texasensis]